MLDGLSFTPSVYSLRSDNLHRLVGLVVRASASRAEDLGFKSRLRRDFSGVKSYQLLIIIGTPVATLQAPCVIGSVLGLVGLVSVCCDWVR